MKTFDASIDAANAPASPPVAKIGENLFKIGGNCAALAVACSRSTCRLRSCTTASMSRS
jgi:hypothetical protein